MQHLCQMSVPFRRGRTLIEGGLLRERRGRRWLILLLIVARHHQGISSLIRNFRFVSTSSSIPVMLNSGLNSSWICGPNLCIDCSCWCTTLRWRHVTKHHRRWELAIRWHWERYLCTIYYFIIYSYSHIFKHHKVVNSSNISLL